MNQKECGICIEIVRQKRERLQSHQNLDTKDVINREKALHQYVDLRMGHSSLNSHLSRIGVGDFHLRYCNEAGSKGAQPHSICVFIIYY